MAVEDFVIKFVQAGHLALETHAESAVIRTNATFQSCDLIIKESIVARVVCHACQDDWNAFEPDISFS